MSESGNLEHLLLVEDNPTDIYVLKQAISDCSPRYMVWSVADGSHALAFLRREPPFEHAPAPALMLLDLYLPARDGADILSEVRAMAAYRTTPVVILSGSEREDDVQCCLRLGATAYVQKTSNVTAYVGRTQALLRDWLGVDGSPS
jgi:CheY-like chemotaxis protein